MSVVDNDDYWRDGIAMAIFDDLSKEAIWDATCMADDGAEFNVAIWAASSLEDIVSWHYAQRKVDRRGVTR